jgi:hypothetical protein
MWIIFRDPETAFLDMDKYIADVIADDDILDYQRFLVKTLGGQFHTIHTNVYFMQPFATTASGMAYFARRYKTWVNAEPA